MLNFLVTFETLSGAKSGLHSWDFQGMDEASVRSKAEEYIGNSVGDLPGMIGGKDSPIIIGIKSIIQQPQQGCL